MATSLHLAKYIALPITIILTCWLLYLPGLGGDFLFDDHPNILNNKAIALDTLGVTEAKKLISSGTAGPLNRPIAMLSFALNHYVTGYDSYWFKITNLIIHCINGMGIFILSNILLNAYRIHIDTRISSKYIYYVSAAVTLAWLIHPINLTSVLYVVQRMNSLAALFSLLGMILYAAGRTRQLRGEFGTAWILFGLLIATPLAVLSKENGILLPVLLTVIEITFFRFKAKSEINRKALIALHVIIVIIPLIALLYLLTSPPDYIVSGYLIRDFTLTERMLTQTRVIWFYISQVLAPVNSQLGIYHDDIAISINLFTPLNTIAAAIGLMLLVATSAIAIHRAPILAFGILFFLAGHSMESTILPLELVHEHRNYLPSVGLIFSLIFYLAYPFACKDSLRIRQASAALLIVIFALVTSSRAHIWSDPVTHITFEADMHPNSPRANLEIGQMYMRMGLSDTANSTIYLTAARHHFKKSSQLSDNFLGGLFALLELESRLRNEIHQDFLDDLLDRLKTKPFSSNTVNWIDYLAKCISKDECSIPEEKMHNIIQASLSNQSIRNKTKANLYTAASNYYFHINDFQGALYMSAESASTMPNNARFRLNLVNLLIILNRFDDAHVELSQAEADDRFGIYDAEINRLTSILNESAKPTRANSFN